MPSHRQTQQLGFHFAAAISRRINESARVFVFVEDLLLCPRLKGQIKATKPWPLWHE